MRRTAGLEHGEELEADQFPALRFCRRLFVFIPELSCQSGGTGEAGIGGERHEVGGGVEEYQAAEPPGREEGREGPGWGLQGLEAAFVAP